MLLSFAIEDGTPLRIPHAAKKFLKEDRIWHQDKYCKLIKNKFSPLDKTYLSKKKIKPRYSFMKYEILPPIDPNLLKVGDVMDGYEGRKMKDGKKGKEYYIVKQKKNGYNYWDQYDSFVDAANIFISTDIFRDIFGKSFDKFFF